jgi:DNA polymerase I-like protein with 3'-5' exonuclease and polymerase domains
VLVGFDSEYGFGRIQERSGGRLHGDQSTMQPVAACLYFEDGRQVRLFEKFDQLQDLFDDPHYTFLVHGAHAEYGFCRRVGLRFPSRFVDTLLMGVMTLHASEFHLPGGVYKNAGLAALAPRYGIPFISAGDKDMIRESIARLRHVAEFGMNRVLDYCLADAKAVVSLYPQLRADMLRLCGTNVERNLVELYQPYSLVMAEASLRGLRFDGQAWDRLLAVKPIYRGRLVNLLRSHGYDHDGIGIGDHAFARLIQNLGMETDWPRTPTGKLSTKEDDIKLAVAYHPHPALRALKELVGFDKFMGQDIGGMVDADGRIRCSILPLAQRTGRNSTVSPNLMGMPGKLRPLLLPDEGCCFLHFDFSQQEPGIAGYLSRDAGLLSDFSDGDVYLNLGSRLALINNAMPEPERRRIRSTILKALMLAILYGKGALSTSRSLGRTYGEARVLLSNFRQTYPRLFGWLKSYVALSLERGWAENIIGYRAAFNVREARGRGHIARSGQNFPIQSSAAACFQLTGIYLNQFGSDIRLPMHDAYLINVADDQVARAEEHQRVMSATAIATEQLFPGLAVRRSIEFLRCFAKDGQEDSLEKFLAELEAGR